MAISNHGTSEDRELHGRRRYITEVWLKRIGLPVAVIVVGLTAVDAHFDLSTLVSVRFLMSTVAICGGTLLASYWMGRLFWKLGVAYDPKDETMK